MRVDIHLARRVLCLDTKTILLKEPESARRSRSSPVRMVEIPGGFEFRDANGVVVANVPTTANPEAFPKALSQRTARRSRRRSWQPQRGQAEAALRRAPAGQQHDDRQGYDRGSAQIAGEELGEPVAPVRARLVSRATTARSRTVGPAIPSARELPDETTAQWREDPPLSAHALEEIRSLRNRPRPTQESTLAVVNRFQREDLVEEVQQPSPYALATGGAPSRTFVLRPLVLLG